MKFGTIYFVYSENISILTPLNDNVRGLDALPVSARYIAQGGATVLVKLHIKSKIMKLTRAHTQKECMYARDILFFIFKGEGQALTALFSGEDF